MPRLPVIRTGIAWLRQSGDRVWNFRALSRHAFTSADQNCTSCYVMQSESIPSPGVCPILR